MAERDIALFPGHTHPVCQLQYTVYRESLGMSLWAQSRGRLGLRCGPGLEEG